jgi:hypothetical protein
MICPKQLNFVLSTTFTKQKQYAQSNAVMDSALLIAFVSTTIGTTAKRAQLLQLSVTLIDHLRLQQELRYQQSPSHELAYM